MKFIVLAVLSLLACVLAKGNSSAKLECHSIGKGSLKLAARHGNHTKVIGNVNINKDATVNGMGTGLLAKADKPLHAEIFKCNKQPHTEVDNPPLVQLRADGKCATVAEGGFGVQLGVQFADCVKNLTDHREQWFAGPPALSGNQSVYHVGPIMTKNEGYGLLSMGVVSTFFDALAFSYGLPRNDKATNLDLVIDTN